MARALRAQGHEIVPVVIGTDGLWHVLPEMPAGGDSVSWPTRVDGALPEASFSGNAPQAVGALEDAGVSVVVLGLHGRWGEDGTVQGLLLRAEADTPAGDGRVYVITVEAMDACGNVGSSSCTVTVPKNGGRGGTAVDSGQYYDATEGH